MEDKLKLLLSEIKDASYLYAEIAKVVKDQEQTITDYKEEIRQLREELEGLNEAIKKRNK